MSQSAFGIIAKKTSNKPCGQTPVDSTILTNDSHPRQQGKRLSLNLIPVPTIQSSRSRLLSPRRIQEILARNTGKIQHSFLVKEGINEVKELIYRDNRMTAPTKERHPRISELSIDKMRLNQDPGRLSNGILEDQVGGPGGTKSARSHAYGLAPISFLSHATHLRNPASPTVSNYLLNVVVMQPKCVEDPSFEAMQIRVYPTKPGLQSTHRPTKDLTTNSTPIPVQSIPPNLGEPILLNTPEDIRYRFMTPTKEENPSQ